MLTRPVNMEVNAYFVNLLVLYNYKMPNLYTTNTEMHSCGQCLPQCQLILWSDVVDG